MAMQAGLVDNSGRNIAVVGVGYWGKNLVRNFHELGALAVLCDADRSVEAKYRSEYANVRFHRDFGAVLSDSSVAAVALATPATTHYEMAKAALDAGKDVLNEKPIRVSCQGGAYLNRQVFDVTLSHFEFPSGVQAHVFVSWLHPVKEQRLVIVGTEKMAVFDDAAARKLILYPHRVEWRHRI